MPGQRRDTGSIERRRRIGSNPALDDRAVERLRKAVAERPDATLDELRIIVTPRKDRWKRLFDHAALRTAFGA
ncbi:MAG: hypothetical protein H0T47_09175 [Planctomycetaceae bacterium]|nr:hypothetical protein [Planctomycetaceae bacterium]